MRGKRLLRVVLQTDFGPADDGIMDLYGICKKICGDIQTFDLSHAIPRFSIPEAARSIAQSLAVWPEETVFVSTVVDPERPAARALCVAKTRNNRYVVAPDNGTLGEAARRYGVEWVRDLGALREAYLESEESLICHGRDVVHCAALVARQLPLVTAGTPYPCAEIVLAAECGRGG